VHELFSEEELVRLKVRNPKAKVAAHPECPEGILRHADQIGSTRKILEYVLSDPAETFIIATEQHIIHQMEKAAPHKKFIPAPGADGSCECARCPFMAKNTMEKLYLCLVNEAPGIELPEDLRLAAKKSLDRMLEMSASIPVATKNAAE
jgi:quinolinate synthase